MRTSKASQLCGPTQRGEIDEPKTEASIRTLRIPVALVHLLKQHCLAPSSKNRAISFWLGRTLCRMTLITCDAWSFTALWGEQALNGSRALTDSVSSDTRRRVLFTIFMNEKQSPDRPKLGVEGGDGQEADRGR